MKKTILAGVLAVSFPAISFANGCEELDKRNFLAVYGQPQPLSSILSESLHKHHWSLDYSQISAEPMIKGEIEGSVKSVIVGLVTKSIKKGWEINLTFDKEKCLASVEILNAEAPSMEESLVSYKNPRTINAVPVKSHIDKKIKKGVSTQTVYRAKKGESLKEVLNRWAKKHNPDAKAVWSYSEDILLGGNVEFIGNLSGSVAGLIEAIGNTGKEINVHVYGNGYIRVEGVK